MIATKDQERAALEQIKEIVTGLGPDSYVGAALTGMFVIAESNIRDDAMTTAQYFIDRSHDMAAKAEHLKLDLETIRENHDQMAEENESMVVELGKERKAHHDTLILLEAAEGKLQAANQEMMMLKARLYDYMVREQAGA